MPEITESAPQLNDLAAATDPVSRTEPYTFTVSLFERQGRADIAWSSNCPARLTDAWVCLYKDGFPSDPNSDKVAWAWAERSSGVFETKQVWGSGWCAAMVARDANKGKWVYVVKTPITGE